MKIAAAYIESKPGDVSYNLHQTLQILSSLEKEHVAFVLLPELDLSGYITSAKEVKKVLQQKDKIFGQLSDFSRNLQLAFSIGFPEEVKGKFYISHFLFEKGKVIGVHRKTHLGPTEKETYNEGNTLEVFNVNDFTVGMQLCFETHFPEISYAQAKQGANLLTMGFASPKENAKVKMERFKRFLCARAYDNACYVLACNLGGITERGAALPALSLIIDPKGNILAEKTTEGNGYCLAEFDTSILSHIYNSKMANFNRFKRNDFIKKFYE